MISQRAQLTFSLVDASDSIGNMSFWLADGVDLDTAAAAAATLRSRIEACSDAVFVRQAVIFSAVESPRPEALGGSDASRVGGLIFSCDTGELDIIEVHGIKDSVIQATGPGTGLLLDRTNPALVALLNELLGGLWCNPFGFTLQALESAFLQIRR